MRLDLSGGKHQSESRIVNTNVVADGVQVFYAFLDQRPDEVLGNATQAETPDHDGVAILDVVNGFVCVRNYLIHCHNELIPTRDCTPRYQCSKQLCKKPSE